MDTKFLSSGTISKLLELTKNSYRPKEVLKKEIGEIRVAELNALITEVIDDNRVKRIFEMRLKRRELYIDWVDGRIS